MTLEEAIAHHRWAAENCVGEVRDEHSQMVVWLAELVRLKAENAKLRKLCADMFKTIGNMDFEWHTLADFKTIAEASEYYDFGQSIAPEYEGRVRELGVGATDE